MHPLVSASRILHKKLPRAAVIAALLTSPALSLAQDAQDAYWPSTDNSASAQQAPMPTAPPPNLNNADAAAEGAQDEKGWLFSSRMVDIGWPKISMPTMRWKGDTQDPAREGPGPIARMTQATRNAFHRTRTAWNNQVEKLKVGRFRPRDEGEPGMFARLFRGEEEPRPPETVADFVGKERPTLR